MIKKNSFVIVVVVFLILMCFYCFNYFHFCFYCSYITHNNSVDKFENEILLNAIRVKLKQFKPQIYLKRKKNECLLKHVWIFFKDCRHIANPILKCIISYIMFWHKTFQALSLDFKRVPALQRYRVPWNRYNIFNIQ